MLASSVLTVSTSAAAGNNSSEHYHLQFSVWNQQASGHGYVLTSAQHLAQFLAHCFHKEKREPNQCSSVGTYAVHNCACNSVFRTLQGFVGVPFDSVEEPLGA